MGTARAEQLRKRLAQGLAARPILRGALRALGAGCFCFVLAGAGLLSEHVPLALAPVCVLPFGPAAVCAYLGAAAGYAMFWGLSSALEPVAAGFLMLAGSCLFRELLPAQRRGFVPAAAGGIYALLGLIFVLQADGGMRAALRLALRLTLLVVSIRALCPAEENARLRPYAAAVCLLAGLVRVELPFGVPLAAVEAAAVCLLADSMEDALLIGAACGLVLDLGSVPSPPQTACAGTIMRQGQANAGDLPAGFCAVCIREEAFRAAVNRALRAQESQLLALQRSEEAREISRALLGQLARFLRAAGQKRPDKGIPRYQLSLGVRAVGLRGDTLCGDCGTSFQCGATQYVLLCDGMGTGSGAQSDAQEAISVLRSLLTLGFDAMDAAAMLNELYVLRGDGCFSTIDLLEVDLCTGEGALYKWGAAPSYLKKGGTVKKIGTASPPPGLGVGEEHRAERVGLSLQRGEQLVLTTDGIPEAACEQYLRASGPLSPRELAAGVVACASESEPDDRTAVIVQLDPASMQPHHTTRRARSVSKSGAEPHI